MTQVNDNTNLRAGNYDSYEDDINIEGYNELRHPTPAIAGVINRDPQTAHHTVNLKTLCTIKLLN